MYLFYSKDLYNIFICNILYLDIITIKSDTLLGIIIKKYNPF